MVDSPYNGVQESPYIGHMVECQKCMYGCWPSLWVWLYEYRNPMVGNITIHNPHFGVDIFMVFPFATIGFFLCCSVLFVFIYYSILLFFIGSLCTCARDNIDKKWTNFPSIAPQHTNKLHRNPRECFTALVLNTIIAVIIYY